VNESHGMSIFFRVFLASSLCLFSYYLVLRLRSPIMYRLIGLALALCLIVFVADPQLSTALARRVGIGRGVDLVLYVSQVCWGFVAIRLYAAQERNAREITVLNRALAIATATRVGKGQDAALD